MSNFRYIEISNVLCSLFPSIPVFFMQILNESFDLNIKYRNGIDYYFLAYRYRIELDSDIAIVSISNTIFVRQKELQAVVVNVLGYLSPKVYHTFSSE